MKHGLIKLASLLSTRDKGALVMLPHGALRLEEATEEKIAFAPVDATEIRVRGTSIEAVSPSGSRSAPRLLAAFETAEAAARAYNLICRSYRKRHRSPLAATLKLIAAGVVVIVGLEVYAAYAPVESDMGGVDPAYIAAMQRQAQALAAAQQALSGRPPASTPVAAPADGQPSLSRFGFALEPRNK